MKINHFCLFMTLSTLTLHFVYFLDLLGGQKWRVETMALFSLQQLFWLCLTPAPSGSYPSSVLLCRTNNQSLLYPNNSPLSGLLLINWAWKWFLIFLPCGLNDLIFFFFAPSWIVLYFTGYAAFYLPPSLWFLLLLVSCGPALSSLLGKRLWLGPAGQHSPGSAWLLFMLVDILLCT